MNIFIKTLADGTVQYDVFGISLMFIIAIAVIVVSFYILKRVFAKFKATAQNEISNERKTLMRIVYSILKFCIILFTILTVLSLLGVNISGAVAGLGIAGAIAGLAVQDALKDFIQGINIASEKFFSIGDIINYDGYRGKVIELTMRNTKLKSIDDDSIRTVGNHLLVDVLKMSPVINIIVSLSYEEDMKYVYKTLGNIAEEAKGLDYLANCEFKGTQNFSESSMDYLMVITCVSTEMINPGRRQFLGLLQERLADAGLEVPYNQLDVHTK